MARDLLDLGSLSFIIVLSVMHPLMKGAIDGMLFGWMPEDYVKHRHARFHEELQSQGE
ncbi:MAG: hypothetical protein PVH80_01820 [Anaerolineae bacterium]|jgi:hypothetical protein